MTRNYTVNMTIDQMCCICEKFYEEDTITTINNETFCEQCYNDNYQTCDICFKNQLNKDIIYCDDCGQSFCCDCFKGDNDICHNCKDKNNSQDYRNDISFFKHDDYDGDNIYCCCCNEIEEDMNDYNKSGHKICQGCFEAKFDCCDDCGYIVHPDEMTENECGVCCINCSNSSDIDSD